VDDFILGDSHVINPFNTSLTIQRLDPDEDKRALSLKLIGHLSGDGVFLLKQAVEPIFISPLPPMLKLFMDDVQYMDSSGVGIIISIIQRAREVGGQIEIHGLSDVGRELFQILRLASLSEIVRVEPAA
jgi:anti-anti-sigma factor